MTQEDLDLAFSDLAKSHKLVCEALDRVQNRSTEQLLEYREVKRKLGLAVDILSRLASEGQVDDSEILAVLE